MRSDRSGHFVGAHTTRTNVYGLVGTVYNGLYLFHIDFPSSVGFTVGVRNILAEDHAFSANTALCHIRHLLFAPAGVRDIIKSNLTAILIIP